MNYKAGIFKINFMSKYTFLKLNDGLFGLY